MTIFRNNLHPVIFGSLLTLFAVTACHSLKSNDEIGHGLGPPDNPVITSIGSQAILIFERGSPLTIPIEGFNLSRPDLNWTVEIQGIKPISSSDVSLQNPKTLMGNPSADVAPDRMELTIPSSYFDDKVKSQDTLEVTISIFAKKSETQPATQKYTSEMLYAKGTRQFVLMQSEDYRDKYLSTCVNVQDISAFPLGESDALALFGDSISKRFYVVELSVRNQTDIDQLISTGMIQAYGRALVIEGTAKVTKKANSNLFELFGIDWGLDEFSYTIPVQIAPISREHAYTIAADQNKYKSREWTIRSLTFAGTLATAVANGFYPSSQDALKAVGIYGNVFIPGFKDLWPDPLPSNLSNLVNYSMPELEKLPSHTSVGHKYIFFSKEELQGMIPEPSALGISVQNSNIQESVPTPSRVSVVYFSFDTLHIPFENIKPPTNQSVDTIVQTALDSIEILSDDRALDFPGWNKSAPATTVLKNTPSGDVSLDDLSKLNTYLGQLASAKEPLPDGLTDLKKNAPTDFDNLLTLAGLWQKTTTALLPENLSQIIDASTIRTMLATYRHQLERIQTDIRSGYSADLYRDQCTQLATQITKLRDRVTLLETVIDSVGSISVNIKPLEAAGVNQMSDADVSNIKKLLLAPLVGLDAARGSSSDFAWMQTAIGAPIPTTTNAATQSGTQPAITVSPTSASAPAPTTTTH